MSSFSFAARDASEDVAGESEGEVRRDYHVKEVVVGDPGTRVPRFPSVAWIETLRYLKLSLRMVRQYRREGVYDLRHFRRRPWIPPEAVVEIRSDNRKYFIPLLVLEGRS
jgi:hypothetical protein